MAEPTLAVQYSDLLAIVSRFLGYGEAPAAGERTNDVLRCIKGGLRMFYRAHRWTFLEPQTTLTTGTAQTCTIAYATTTVTCNGHGYSNGDAITFATDGTLPAGMYTETKYYVINSATNTFKFSATSGGAAVTLTSAGSGTHTARKTTWYYDLPDGFGQFIGTLHHAADLNYAELKYIGVQTILEMRNTDDKIDQPRWFSIRPKSMAPSSGQRFEVMLYPEPDEAYVLSYQYRAVPDMIDSTTMPYPLGGAEHAETIQEACLGWAEKFYLGAPDSHYADYMQVQLPLSIQRDSEKSPETLGKNVDCSADTYPVEGIHNTDPDRFEGITYSGVV